jgi:hypothetical protein
VDFLRRFAHNRAMYEDKFVAFVDILGFSDLGKRSEEGGVDAPTVDDILNLTSQLGNTTSRVPRHYSAIEAEIGLLREESDRDHSCAARRRLAEIQAAGSILPRLLLPRLVHSALVYPRLG